MMRVPPRAVGVLIAVAAAGLGTPVLALDSTQAQGRAALQVRAVESEMGKIQAAAARARNRRTSPARRIAEGEILLRNRDYEHAIHLFHQVVELYEQGQAPATAHADALFLLGEAYFRDEQLLAARRYFTRLLDRAGDRPYASFAGRALSRLVDVCLRGGDLSGLGPLFASMGHLPDSDATGSLQYARGKALYARGDLAAASAALNAVPRNTPYAHQAGYLLGVLVTKQLTPTLQEPAPPAGGAVGGEGGADAAEQNLGGAQQPRLVDYTPAIAQFRKVTRLPPRSRAHRHVVDLAWMAIGRLYYEMERPLEAAHAYSHVDRKSPEFSNMLYELGWVYVRLGDFRRAQRALEIQRITDPQNMAAADGALLRADLLLRQGEYEQALGIYRSVRRTRMPTPTTTCWSTSSLVWVRTGRAYRHWCCSGRASTLARTACSFSSTR
jgi:tetratricopeptide (TPR) repeat protein